MPSFSATRHIWILLLLGVIAPVSGLAEEEPIIRFANAVEKGDLTIVREMLTAGLDPNTCIPGSGLNYTPLFLAVQSNQTAVTEALLKAGADPSIEDGNGDPVMVHAIHRDRLDQARLLIRHGVSIDSRNRGGITALMRGSPYEDAADIQANIDLGANLELTDAEGTTALMKATGSGNIAAMEVLLKSGAKPDVVNKEGKTALMLALSFDLNLDEKEIPDVVKLLIKSGADPNLTDRKGANTLIMALASYRCPLEAIDAILSAKPDVGHRDEDGRDSLFHANLHDRTRGLTPRLVELGADLKTTDNDDADLLMWAAAGNDPGQVRFLLDHGLTPDRTTKSGEMAVHFALRAGRWESSSSVKESLEKRTVEILKLILEHGASLTKSDADGDTLLHLAAFSGQIDVFAYLLPFFKNLNIKNQRGETPLHLAAASSAEIVDLLLPKYPDPDVRDLEGQTAFMNASAVGYENSQLSLLKAGANIDAADKNGTSVLDGAVSDNNPDKIRFLIAHGANPKMLRDPGFQLLRVSHLFHDGSVKAEEYAYLVGFLASLAKDIDIQDANKMTTLVWVATSNNIAALEAVLKHKPDLNSRSPDGRTALMWAACSGAEKAMAILLKAGSDASLRDSTGRTADEWLAWPGALGSKPSSTKGDDSILLESLTKGREAVLREYLQQEKWTKNARVLASPPLHLAAALGIVDVVQELLKRGAPPDQLSDDQSTPLMEAATNGKTEAVRILLDHGANPSLRNASGQRPVDLAVHMRQIDSARSLLRAVKSLSSDESPLLAELAAVGDETLLRDFLKAGASITPLDKRAVDSDPFARRDQPKPEAPLVAAAMRNDAAMLKILAEFPAASGTDDPRLLSLALHTAAENGHLINIRFLIEDCKADPNTLLSDSLGGVTRIGSGDGKEVKFVDGFSPLSRALEQGYIDVVRYLVERGAAIIGRTRGGLCPLTYVMQHHQPELLELFLKHNAPTNLVDLDGSTALHFAAAANDEIATRLLLEHGADPKAKDARGRTPLEAARTNEATKTTALLENLTK